MTAFNFEQARFNMIEQQIRPWDVLDQRALDTLARIPREDFVPERYRNLAFGDVAIPLGHGEFMLKPNVEGRILQALALQSTDHVLEVGTGSGYLTACLARMTASVVSVDMIPDFTENARRKLKAHGLSNVVLHTGDASRGWGEQRYPAIAVTGSVAIRRRGLAAKPESGRTVVHRGRPAAGHGSVADHPGRRAGMDPGKPVRHRIAAVAWRGPGQDLRVLNSRYHQGELARYVQSASLGMGRDVRRAMRPAGGGGRFAASLSPGFGQRSSAQGRRRQS